EQSEDIAVGVNNAFETRESQGVSTGAGDQGLMFGFATNETKEFMPSAPNPPRILGGFRRSRARILRGTAGWPPPAATVVVGAGLALRRVWRSVGPQAHELAPSEVAMGFGEF
ncbi:MAG TPA: hypothetical protein IAA98_04140, partial [Candidatus Avipropionibacterium avicola]|nr:hypothetical protein [Candidatus Avipropionibacterium avicola]